MNAVRCLVAWIPDWPVFAAFGPEAADAACAVIRDNTVLACSAPARAQGVRRGQRRRLAQSLCPSLRFLPADPLRDERVYQPVLRSLEELVPGVQVLGPGLASVRARGIARYHGGEEPAARAILRLLRAQGHPTARVGVADGLFTAEQAARHGDPILVVESGGSAGFLAPLPVSLLEDDDLTSLLSRLGVHTMAQFARLAEIDVRDRLGERGVHLRALAAGADPRPFTPRSPDADPAREVVFETPLEQAEQVGFAVRQAAESMLDGLEESGAVCTAIRVDLQDERGGVQSRIWQHPTCFDAPGLVDRVRWQLEGATHEFTGGIVAVRLSPAQTDDAAHHQPGLFGQGGHERMHHAISRVQALLGHDAVVTASVDGGRLLADRQRLTPWGERTVHARPPDRPWPGHLPPPLPGEVFVPPKKIRVSTSDGSAVDIDPRGALSAPPARIDDTKVVSWAGPWRVRDRSWDSDGRLAHRLQLLDERRQAWIVLHEDGTWWAEGAYR